MTDQDPNDAFLIRIMRSDLPDDAKAAIIRRLIAEREQHEQRIGEWVDELIAEAEKALRNSGE